jgi:hypothetical protein
LDERECQAPEAGSQAAPEANHAVPLCMADRIDIQENRTGKWIFFFLSLALTAGGLWYANKNTLVGLLCAVFFGYVSSVWVKKLMDPRTRLSLKHDGIEDRDNGFGLVAWGDIASANLETVRSATFISLHVVNEEAYLDRLGPIKRRAAMLSKSLGHSAVTVPMSGLQIKADELLSMIQKRIG